MLEKTTQMNLLYDFYGMMLTEKQREFVELYYLDDLSLAEIAEQFDISRQAVHDNLRRAGAQLVDLESKLRLVERFERRRDIGDRLNNLIRDLPEPQRENIAELVRELVEE
ncbi:MAG TPA: putative DNA-binding protein [Bacilli bacterium]|nr:putative DNA-binding protein [Bacilli bacterium]